MLLISLIVIFGTVHLMEAFLKDTSLENGIESCLSEENFEIIIEATFQHSHCCNIYLFEMSDNIESIFNVFIKIYHSSYVVNDTTYSCYANLILASNETDIINALSIIPTKIATIKILIILDANLDRFSQLFNTSLYRNTDVNLVSLSGVWKLSANFLEERKFIKCRKLVDIIPKRKAPDFRGRELKLAAYYKPPHSYLNKTMTQYVNRTETDVFVADTEEERDGMEVHIIMILAQKLNFKWTVNRPKGSYKYGRKVNGSIWVGGMIEQVVKGEVDMAFSGIWLTEESYTTVNLTEPWHEISINFLVPRPKPYTSFWALTRPFSKLVWLSLTVTVLLYSTYLYCRSFINPAIPERYRHFVITLTELIGRLTGVWCPRNTDPLGFQLHLWQTVGLMFVAAYSSSLAARLTNTEYEDRINTIKQFIEANLTWGRTGSEPNFPSLFDLEDPYASQLPDRYQHEENDEDHHNKILEGNYAIIGRLVDGFFFPEDNVSVDDLRNYRVMENPVGKFYVSFAVKPWLLQPVNHIINQLRETGILSHIIKDVLRRRAGSYLREVRKEYDTWNNCPRVLSLTPLGAGFALLISGYLLSSVVFYTELKSAEKNRQIESKLTRNNKLLYVD